MNSQNFERQHELHFHSLFRSIRISKKVSLKWNISIICPNKSIAYKTYNLKEPRKLLIIRIVGPSVWYSQQILAFPSMDLIWPNLIKLSQMTLRNMFKCCKSCGWNIQCFKDCNYNATILISSWIWSGGTQLFKAWHD